MFIKIKNISLEITRELANLYSRMIEIISNVPLIKISGTEHYEKERFRKITTNLAILEYQQTKFQSLVPMLTETLVMLAIIISFLISVKTFKINVLTYLPFIVAYLYVFLRVFNEINAFLESISGMFQNVEPFKAYETKLNEAKKSKIKNGSVKFRSLLHEIKFQNVSFSYENEKTTLHHLNFSIPKGSFTAIIGQTGSGKTTIAKLLSGLFYPQEGEIIIDETNLKDLDLKNWLEKIGFISQDVMIFNDSIKNNLIYGYFNATQKNIDSAAKIADIYNFIKNLPNGYDTNIGERGSKLSGGQKQRLAIARAVIKNPEILILDEATSSLDSKTEKTIQSALEKVSAGRTVIAIAHRLSTIIKADNIIVLEKGQIVEQGTPTNLLCQNGYYKKYYDLQFKN
ncbi:MAG: hypothetical protein A2430_02015 [Candidatus Liptonbacteria bacterium RIFOXYC1_FULL_36_8]|uniref:ABC transporter domain-containing protein n=3 Tax=Candidatus Liptoniibacteriota TaxID=1817909 RepID=A0A1G2CLY7_9BACT|nr:MAG: hypothetical protein A2390_02745 [Candidatus Liptonbacteria bacterium RIFOXYB1_FULL_36_10]OGZ03478.1 MAG: hypothetical protein A2604_00700 [Candidatus Liptonbacteria bacterium RIFOXYD1_FULL_36_11]OGZ03505.1 MAG: hypothetical protein A2430_02015 [Candidatus Liptonbacteria bacterium RIFOXYC1_FULL_36_8]